MFIRRACFEGFSYRYSTFHNSDTLPTILFVGGSFQSLESINNLQPIWPESWNAIVVELPGFGLSDLLPDDYGFDFNAACIEHVMAQLDPDRQFVAFGYSYGAGPLFRVVAREPDRFTGLVLGGASTSFTPHMIDVMEGLVDLAATNSPQFPNRFMDVFYSKNPDIENTRLARVMLMRLLRSLTDRDRQCFASNYTRLLREQEAENRVIVPTIAFTGKDDTFTQAARLTGFHNFCSRLDTAVIQGADHFFHLQKPATAAALIEQFVSTACQVVATA